MTSAPPWGISLASIASGEVNPLHSFNRKCLAYQRIAFFFLRTDIDNGHPRVLYSHHVLHIDGTHLGKLHQMGRSGIHIGSTVNQK